MHKLLNLIFNIYLRRIDWQSANFGHRFTRIIYRIKQNHSSDFDRFKRAREGKREPSRQFNYTHYPKKEKHMHTHGEENTQFENMLLLWLFILNLHRARSLITVFFSIPIHFSILLLNRIMYACFYSLTNSINCAIHLVVETSLIQSNININFKINCLKCHKSTRCHSQRNSIVLWRNEMKERDK